MDPSNPRGAPVGNQNASKGEENKWTNCPVDCASKRKRKSQNSPERIIARLKRDAASDPHAEALLGSIEAGDIKPYRAAVEMGLRQPSGGHKWGARNKKGPIGPFCCSSNRLF